MGGFEVEFVDVWKRYGDRWALRGIDLKVEKGEFVSLMGPNGSGKSTLAKITATVEVPTKGSVIVEGRDVVSEADEVRKLISFLPEEEALSGLLTGMENLYFFGRLMGLKPEEIRARAKELAEELGILDHLGEKVKNYSKGMKRKLSLIATMLPDRPLVILDEPTSGLDPITRRELLGILFKRAGGSTLLMNTHIGEDAEASGRVVLMSKGRILASGRPEELKSRFVRGKVLNVRVPVRLKELEERLKRASVRNAITVTDEGYRVYVDEGFKDVVAKEMESLGVKAEVTEVPPSLEDAYTIAVMGHEG
ncbi:MAG: ABC transporter ATP-binding protein [Thaumarchaeota archaeon]|nr:ABC transporter ATP-binding protein [Nitrososphaerota archaeon]